MSFIIWLIVGGVVGWIASKLMNTDPSMGLIANVIVGIVGSIIGGTLYVLVTTGRFDLAESSPTSSIGSFIVSVIGAVIFIWILKMFRSPAV